MPKAEGKVVRQAIEKLSKSKSHTKEKAFLQALACHDIYLAAIDKHNNPHAADILIKLPFARHERSENQCDFLIQQNNHNDRFFLGFSDLKSFETWQPHYRAVYPNITAIPISFSDLCLLMKEIEREEIGLILNPYRDNLIIDNSIFGDLKNISTDELVDVAHRNYIAMTPLEQGDFSFELLHMLNNEFKEQDWIEKVWAASAQINNIESFLLIIADKKLGNDIEQHKIVQQKLLALCAPFLVGAALNIQSSTTSPFGAAILNYDPIFIAETV